MWANKQNASPSPPPKPAGMDHPGEGGGKAPGSFSDSDPLPSFFPEEERKRGGGLPSFLSQTDTDASSLLSSPLLSQVARRRRRNEDGGARGGGQKTMLGKRGEKNRGTGAMATLPIWRRDSVCR